MRLEPRFSLASDLGMESTIGESPLPCVGLGQVRIDSLERGANLAVNVREQGARRWAFYA